MSLILEALRKLERDRHTPERGFLVLAPPAWAPAGERTWSRTPALLGVAALTGAAVAVVLLRPGRPAPTPPETSVRTAAAAAATTAVTPVTAVTLSPAVPPARIAWPNPRASTAPPEAGEPAPRAAARPLERPEVVAATAAPTEDPAADVEPSEPSAPEPVEGGAAIVGPLRLEAIAERDGHPVAVVNGQLVRVGDRVGAGTVVRIGTTDIEIETDGRRHILRF